MSNTRPENFARTFKDGNKVFSLQLGLNAHGSFLMISELLHGHRKGLIIVTEGKLGSGWRGFGFHLRKVIAPNTLGYSFIVLLLQIYGLWFWVFLE